MTDYDAAAALLMLSSGGRTSPPAESNNNYHSKGMAAKPRLHCSPASTTTPESSPTTVPVVDLTSLPVTKMPSQSKDSHCGSTKIKPRSVSSLLALDLTASPESKVTTQSTSTRGAGTKPPKPVPSRKEDLFPSSQRSLLRVQRNEPVEKMPQNDAGAVSRNVTGLTFSTSSESDAALIERGGGGRNSLLYGVARLGSSSPPDLVLRWDSSRTSSPIVPSSSCGLLPSPHSAHDSDGELRIGPTVSAAVYDSPGMNGFALQLNSNGGMIGRGKYAVSSPEPSHLVAPEASKGERKSRRSYHHPPPCSAGSNVEEKSLNSPTDSGVSSIHDELLQPNLNVRMWPKGSHLGEGLPALVRTELRKIVDASTASKEQYTKTKMIDFPLEFRFNPNKSRFRKECANNIDNQDREKNNEASRRSRHKKKLMTHVMSISLEFDRNENRQLYLQERWLTNMIFELEEKALNTGTEAQVLRKLRANCGFQ